MIQRRPSGSSNSRHCHIVCLVSTNPKPEHLQCRPLTHAHIEDFHVLKMANQSQIPDVGQSACTRSGMSLSVMLEGSKVILCSMDHWPLTRCLTPSCFASTPISSSLLSKGHLAGTNMAKQLSPSVCHKTDSSCSLRRCA